MVNIAYKETVINGTWYRCGCGGTGCPIFCPMARMDKVDRNYAKVQMTETEFYPKQSKRNNGHPASPRRRKK